ncbi:MFS transporter [Bowmanella dokdonensis]|uniref:MFS transporter n=1 Tax=Bowmanella dokdonensis TaxID=751969 RepID=A0A939DSR6_9ALTE|nr:MFS transporter [Bowmanella dokdonensis]MBN7827231.1 MFS transporter [Bowmanella dokdonensis]
MPDSPSKAAMPLFLLLITLLIALNLRPALASVGPLLAAMQEELPLSYAGASLLTSLPVMIMGIACFFGFALAGRIGMGRTISLSIGILTLALLFRFRLDSTGMLILTALLAGLGIALIQCLLPALIKANFPGRVDQAMGLYITAIMAGASMGSALSPWLAGFFEWRGGMGHWVWLALTALLCWQLFLSRWHFPARPAASPTVRQSFWGNRRAWQLALLFGLSTAAFVCVLAWLAPFAMEQGLNAQQAGLLLGFLTLMEVTAGLLFPAWAARVRDRRPVLFSLCLLQLAGFAGLILFPQLSIWFWATLLGLGVGGMFPMVMIVTMDHQEDAVQAGELAAFVQGMGYLIASLAPWGAGLIRDSLQSFSLAWGLLAGGACVLLTLCMSLTPASYRSAFTLQSEPA